MSSPTSTRLIPTSLALGLMACGTLGLNPQNPEVVDSELPATEGPESRPTQDSSSTDASGSGSDQDSHTAAEPDETDPEAEAETEELSCTYDRFPVAMHQATQDNSIPDQPLFIYQARNTDELPFDELQILSYQAAPYHGPSAAGSYSLAGSNYADCALCVLVIGDCSDSYQCDQVFFAAEGTLQVQSLSDHGGPFRATLTGAVFEEVSIDSDTYTSTPVPGGETWCIDEISIDVSTYLYD